MSGPVPTLGTQWSEVLTVLTSPYLLGEGGGRGGRGPSAAWASARGCSRRSRSPSRSSGSVGFFLLARQLRTDQIATYASYHRLDVRNIESIGRRNGTTLQALPAIDDLLSGIGERPGTLETRLIDARSIVMAAGDDPSGVGQPIPAPGSTRALRSGVSYAGLEPSTNTDARDYQFIAPVNLPDGRYVLEVSYDHRVLDANFRSVRRTLMWIGLLALLGRGCRVLPRRRPRRCCAVIASRSRARRATG